MKIKSKYRSTVVVSGTCPKCKNNNDTWINRICPNCGYVGNPIIDE